MWWSRFGLFSLTFMYFRSMMLLRREQESWGGTGDAVGGGGGAAKVTSERKKMILEQRNAENRGIMLDKAMNKARTGEERR